uniref:cobalt ECF transporter T component CbiQ n=1 Tax=Rhodococcus qingshengii TaxID=334542 RepID=UPI00211A3356|nr:cobalt ECF transporter T component CbiQ [Rhodococcus qingshengii]
MAAIDATAWRSGWRERSVAEKSVLYGGIIALSVSLPPWPAAPMLFLICIVSARLADVPLKHLAGFLCAPAIFIVIAAGSTVVSVGINPWRMTTSTTALLAGTELIARALTASAATLMFASTTPMTMLMNSLRRVGVPAACVDVVTVMYRLIFVLLESVNLIRLAQISRLGYSTPRRSLNSAGLLVTAVLTHAWSQARRMEIGLSGRDFGVPLPALDTTHVSAHFVRTSLFLFSLIGVVSIFGSTS